MANIIMFPGQGSQHVGMGEPLFNLYKKEIADADSLLGYSIQEVCIDNPNNILFNTIYAQPVIYVINALSFKLFKEQNSSCPECLLGHSLGEYNALQAAGAFDFMTGLEIIKNRAMFMGQVENGLMAAVKGFNTEQIKEILFDSQLNNLDIANINSPNQVVLSGNTDEIYKAKTIFEHKGAELYLPLNVSGAFHSRFMKPSALQYLNYLKQFDFCATNIPVISNITAEPYPDKNIADILCQQLYKPVNWRASIEHCLKRDNPNFIEIGSSSILTRLLTDF